MIEKDLVLPFNLLFSSSSLSPLFLFPCVSVCYFGVVVFYDVFMFPLVHVSCFCSNFVCVCVCGYHEVCIKYLKDKIVLFRTIVSFSANSILSSCVYIGLSFYSSLPCSYCHKLSFFISWVHYQIEEAIVILNTFLPLNFILYCLTVFWYRVLIFLILSIHHLTQSFVYFCLFVSGLKAPFNISCK